MVTIVFDCWAQCWLNLIYYQRDAQVISNSQLVQKGTEITTFPKDINPPIKTTIDFENSFSSLNKFDHGAYGGIGFGFNFGMNQLFIEGNYYHGLKDFDDDNTSKNRSLQLGLGFSRSLRMKKK